MQQTSMPNRPFAHALGATAGTAAVVSRGIAAFLAIAAVLVLFPSTGPGGEPPKSAINKALDPANPCTRYAGGSIISNPLDLFSKNGVLRVDLLYNTQQDADGRILFCFTTPNGAEAPTLHIHPGDRLVMTIKNNLPPPLPGERVPAPTVEVCGASSIGPDSLNVHFHGTNTSPVCHQDEVIHTLVNSGETFTYNLKFPSNEPPGLYWYHPHVHGLSDAAVMGGASGALIVEGLEAVQPAVARLPERVFVVRDQTVAGQPLPGGPNDVPSWDVTVNYVPSAYPDYNAGIIKLRPKEKQLWRVVNATADTVLDLQVQYDGVPQTLQVVALDGVPTGSQDGTRRGKIVDMTDILVPTAGRAEFIVKGPDSSVHDAQFLTLNVDTGPIGDVDPTRPLAFIQTRRNPRSAVASPTANAHANSAGTIGAVAESRPELTMPAVSGPPGPQRFEGLAKINPSVERTLYFSEVITDERDPEDWLNTQFFITVDGATPELFDPNNPPAITTTQGSVEDWTIENRSLEVHEFHIHQIHFLLLAINGVAVPPEQQQFLDTVQVPYWSGSGPYPSVTVRMDFRGPDIGDFVYHCHILAHEDGGMMAIIRVLPKKLGWFGPYGRFRTMLASIPWFRAKRSSSWCVSGRTVKRGRYSSIEALALGTPEAIATRRRRDAIANWREISGIPPQRYEASALRGPIRPRKI